MLTRHKIYRFRQIGLNNHHLEVLADEVWPQLLNLSRPLRNFRVLQPCRRNVTPHLHHRGTNSGSTHQRSCGSESISGFNDQFRDKNVNVPSKKNNVFAYRPTLYTNQKTNSAVNSTVCSAGVRTTHHVLQNVLEESFLVCVTGQLSFPICNSADFSWIPRREGPRI